MPLKPHMTLQPFEKWAIDFVGPISPQGKMSAHYIIIAIEYLTLWVEAQPVKDCTTTTVVKFLFENVLTSVLTDEFQIYHKQSTSYHLEVNGTIEEFKKKLETTLTKVYNAKQNDWDLRIPVVLWKYQTTCKKLTSQTPFWLVYGKEAIMPMEYIVPSLRITAITGMENRGALEEWLAQLEELEEEQFLARFHQQF
eukprot:PITA_34714